MRWFLLPYEAHLYITDCYLPRVQVPFQPRNYESDNWYDEDYLNEWDKHWNPGFWEEVKNKRRPTEESVPQITSRWQWTINPANHSPSHRVELPIPPKRYLQLAGKKETSVSMSNLYYSSTKSSDLIGSTASLSPISSGYSSGGEDRVEREEGMRRGKKERKGRGRKRRTVKVLHGDNSQDRKCIVM